MSETETKTESAPKKKLKRDDSTCSVDGCKRPYRAKGYCNVHYKAWRHGEIAAHRGRYKTCTKEGCRKPRTAFGGFCEEHVAKKAEASA